jgi:hypothetical protein
MSTRKDFIAEAQLDAQIKAAHRDLVTAARAGACIYGASTAFCDASNIYDALIEARAKLDSIPSVSAL